MDDGLVDRTVRKLNEAKAISEWHFRDAVAELLELCVSPPYDFMGDDE